MVEEEETSLKEQQNLSDGTEGRAVCIHRGLMCGKPEGLEPEGLTAMQDIQY